MDVMVSDLAESSRCLRFRNHRCSLPHIANHVGTLISEHFAAQYLACMCPCQRFTCSLATARA